MSQAEDMRRSRSGVVTGEDIRQLTSGATPHFALQIRNRIAALIGKLPPEDPVRAVGEREIARLEAISRSGQDVGEAAHTGEQHLPSLAGS